MRSILTIAALFGISSVAAADVDSGPKEGEKAAELTVWAVTGESKNKEIDYAKIQMDKATVFVFVRADKWDRPMFRYVKKLDETVGDSGRVVAIWLTDDAAKSKEYLPKIAQYFNGTALTVFTGDKAGPKGWAINDDAHLTAVVVRGGKVLKSFGYRSLNETDAPAVIDVLKK